MNWPENILKEKRTEVIAGAVFAFTSALGLLLWRWAFGHTFQWTEVDPFSVPLSYQLLSALVFIGPGSYLFHFTDFYIDLWHLFREVLEAPGLHRVVKLVIWLSMMALVYFVLRIVFYILNLITTVTYNVAAFVLYIAPPVGFGLVARLLVYLLLKKDWLVAKLSKQEEGDF